MLKNIATSSGYGGQNIGIMFPMGNWEREQYDEIQEEEDFDYGICCFQGSSGTLVDYDTFYKYLRIIVDYELQYSPEYREGAYFYLNKFKEKYDISDTIKENVIIKEIIFP